MTKEETIKVLQSIEDRAVNFPNMTACDWVAIAAAKRHLTDISETKEVDLDKEVRHYLLHEHKSPLTTIMHQIDMHIETQYNVDIENAFRAGFGFGLKVRKRGEE